MNNRDIMSSRIAKQSRESGVALSRSAFRTTLRPDGNAAVVSITCFVDEANIPAQFGPIADLDGVPGTVSNDVSASYEILPVRLQLSVGTQQGTQTRELYLVLDGD